MVVTQTDIAIIGAGIQGVFIAYYAKKMYPEKTVALFEMGVPGHGITAWSAHLHLPYGTGDKFVLTMQSMRLYEQLRREYPDFPLLELELRGICTRGSCNAVLSSLIEKNVEFDSFNYPFCDLPATYLRMSGMTCYVSKRNLVGYLIGLIIKLGVKVYEGIEIKSVTPHSNELILIKHTGERVAASLLFTCTGKEIVKLLNAHGKDVKSKKVVALHVDNFALLNDPVYYFFDEDSFLLPQPYYGRYLFSFYCDEWNANDSSDLMITDDDLKSAKKILTRYTKDFSTSISGGQVYLDIYNNPPSSPIIYEVDKNHYVVGATGGSGVRLAPALAVKALNLIHHDNI